MAILEQFEVPIHRRPCYNQSMENRVRRFALFVLLLGLLAGIGEVWRVRGEEQRRYFPETGHTVGGAFLEVYESVPDAEFLFGYPITETVEHEGVTLQYFQRGVLQRRAGDVYPTTLGLGLIFWEAFKDLQRMPVESPLSLTGCERVNDHAMCYEFLAFYRRYGAVIGPPVSDALWEDGVLVQYFVAARLVYQNGRIVPSDLGEWYFQMQEPDKSARQPVPPGNFAPARSVVSVRVLATVEKVTTSRNRPQTLYVLATDQTGTPLPHAAMHITLMNVDGAAIESPVNGEVYYTDDQGVAVIGFDTPNVVGRVVVQVVVTAGSHSGMTQTSFRVWY